MKSKKAKSRKAISNQRRLINIEEMVKIIKQRVRCAARCMRCVRASA